MDDAEFHSWYGPWAGRTPADVATLLDGYAGLWWVAGGWAIEAFTGVSRPHDDIDPSTLLCDLPALRRHLAGRLHTWTASAGALAPLHPADRPDASAAEVLPEGCGQLWLRPDATSPWEYDLLLSPGTPHEWVFKRDDRIRLPMAEALWERDGIRYLRPEVQLLLKARGQRPKDRADLDACLPLLDDDRRAWLADSLALAHPDHPWKGLLR